MKLDEIKKSILNIYRKDAFGQYLYPGDCVINAYIGHFLCYEDEHAIIDYSSCKMITPPYANNNSAYDFLYLDDCKTWHEMIPAIGMIEYFSLDVDFIFPFVHQYSTYNYRFWHMPKDSIKINSKLKDIYIRYKMPIDRFSFDVFRKRLMNRSICPDKISGILNIAKPNEIVAIPFSFFSDHRYLKTVENSIIYRKEWEHKTGKFAKIFFLKDDDKENRFNKEAVVKDKVKIRDYNSASKGHFKIFCQHPVKNHTEMISHS